VLGVIDVPELPAVTEFVESRLLAETDGNVLSYYLSYLVRVRRLKLQDLPWLHRWIDSGEGMFRLMTELLRSEIPLATQLDLVVKMGQQGGTFIDTNDQPAEVLGKLREMATNLVADPRITEFSPLAQTWFKLVAEGVGPDESWQKAIQENIGR